MPQYLSAHSPYILSTFHTPNCPYLILQAATEVETTNYQHGDFLMITSVKLKSDWGIFLFLIIAHLKDWTYANTLFGWLENTLPLCSVIALMRTSRPLDNICWIYDATLLPREGKKKKKKKTFSALTMAGASFCFFYDKASASWSWQNMSRNSPVFIHLVSKIISNQEYTNWNRH